MNKIKYELYNRIIEDLTLTSDEISMLVYIARHSDDRGYLSAVYYKEASAELGISYSQFYNIIKSLRAKKYIGTSKDYICDMNVRLYDNDFYNENSSEMEYSSYMNLNIAAFGKDFYSFRANAKRLIMELVKRGINTKVKKALSGERRTYAKLFYIPDNIYFIYSRKLGVSRRMIKSYFKEIRDYISIGHKVYEDDHEDVLDIVTIKEAALRAVEITYTDNYKEVRRQKPARYDADRHFVQGYCRRQGISYDDDNLANCSMLMTQYERKAQEKKISIKKLLLDALDAVNEAVLKPAALNRVLNNILKAI